MRDRTGELEFSSENGSMESAELSREKFLLFWLISI